MYLAAWLSGIGLSELLDDGGYALARDETITEALKMGYEIYKAVSQQRTLAQRFADGSRAQVKLLEPGRVVKTYPTNEEPIDWEFKCLQELQLLEIVPELEADQGWEFGIVMALINSGTGIGEYVHGYFTGVVPESVLVDILGSTRMILNQFWDAGWVHGDLHTRNIVIDFCTDTGWCPKIIDFSSSFHDTTRSDFADLLGLIVEELGESDSDAQFLRSDLWDIHDFWRGGTAVDSGFVKALNELF